MYGGEVRSRWVSLMPICLCFFSRQFDSFGKIMIVYITYFLGFNLPPYLSFFRLSLLGCFCHFCNSVAELGYHGLHGLEIRSFAFLGKSRLEVRVQLPALLPGVSFLALFLVRASWNKFSGLLFGIHVLQVGRSRSLLFVIVRTFRYHL